MGQSVDSFVSEARQFIKRFQMSVLQSSDLGFRLNRRKIKEGDMGD